MNLLSPTQANGPIVLCWEGAGAMAWKLLGSCPEGPHGGPSLFAWPQNGSAVTHAEGSGPTRGYLVLALPAGGSRWGAHRSSSEKGPILTSHPFLGDQDPA